MSLGSAGRDMGQMLLMRNAFGCICNWYRFGAAMATRTECNHEARRIAMALESTVFPGRGRVNAPSVVRA